jgi:hypothetical protein
MAQPRLQGLLDLFYPHAFPLGRPRRKWRQERPFFGQWQ